MKELISEVKPTVHNLKTWPEYFNAVRYGFKSFELRKNDRDFHKGDYLILEEWDPSTKDYTNDKMIRKVVYVLHGGQFGLEKGHVILGLQNANDYKLFTEKKR